MPRAASVLSKLRKICLALPDAKETITWGEPHFRVGEKIFAGCGDEDGRTAIGFKLELDHADAIIQRPGFRRARYVGHKGWVSLDAGAIDDWNEVRGLILESYRLIAPKELQASLTVPTERTAARGARRARTGENAPSGARRPNARRGSASTR